MINQGEIQKSAHALVERHGAHAVEVARGRADAVAREGDLLLLDAALLILSEVERLSDEVGGLSYGRSSAL
jgi:hypothetical protein